MMNNEICTVTTVKTQRAFVLKALKNNPSLSTFELRELGICSPAPRIKELIDSGIIINSVRHTAIDAIGVKHQNVSRYWLAEIPDEDLENYALGRKSY